VTSNSETALHFYPADRAKIYRANKILRVAPPEVDYTSLAEQINKHIDNPAIVTNAAEIRELLAASSTVSADYHLEPDGESIVESYTDESDRPDISIEHTDALKTMYRAIETLSLREQKLLKMRGISK
jgi:DNA-directed RNA polymerase specialized sigma subunit